MGLEIERKFLVNGDWRRELDPVYLITQGYLSTDPVRMVRIRIEQPIANISPVAKQACITIKGSQYGITRKEYEYQINFDEAQEMIEHLCSNVISKHRTYQSYPCGTQWVIDEFLDSNKGLVMAEIELASETDSFYMPSWLDQEVSKDFRYANSYLAVNPYQKWSLTDQMV